MRRFNKKYADECYQIWREHKSAGTGALPTAPRFIFYELVDNGIIEKKPLEKGQRRPSQDVSDALMWLRRYKLDPNGGFNKDGSVKVVWCEPGENGLIPWDDIRDDTRSLRNFSGYPTFRAAVEARMSHPYLDPWKGRWPVIVAEDRAVAVSLEDLAREYRVPVTSTNGQAGGFIQTDVIPAVRENGRAHLVLYCGDLDRGGESIEGNLREQLGTEVEIERLLLTEEQAREHHLEGKMQFDHRDGASQNAIQMEALTQAVIVDIVRVRLDELLPRKLKNVEAQERRERRRLLQWLEVIRES